MCVWPAAFLLLAQLADAPRLERLPNGLNVAIVTDHGLPLLSVQVWYRVGSSFDNVDQPGLCHIARTLLEHRDDAAVKLRAAGVRVESRTLRDACVFSSIAPPAFLDFVLGVEAARMAALEATPKQIARAVRIAARPALTSDALQIQGMRTSQGLMVGGGEFGPIDEAHRALLRHAFPRHPYQHPPALVAAALAAAAPRDVGDFLSRWFVPGNATVVIIGDLSDAVALDAVRRHFGKLPRKEPPRRADLELLARETVVVSEPGGSNAGVDLAWVTHPLGYFENTAVDVLMRLLCDSQTGPLALRMRALRASPPRIRRFAWREQGLLTLSVDAPATDLERVEGALRSVLESWTAGTPDVALLNRAKNQSVRAVLERHAGFSRYATSLAVQEVVGGDMLSARIEPDRVRRTTPHDLRQAARLLADRRRIVRRRTGNTIGGVKDTKQRGDAAASGSIDKVEWLKSPPAKPLRAGEALELLARFAPQDAIAFGVAGEPEIVTVQVAAGVQLAIHASPALRIATVRTAVRVDADAEPLFAQFQNGSRRHSAEQLADYLSYHAIDMAYVRDGAYAGLIARGPAERVPQMLEWQAELIQSPRIAAASSAPSGEDGGRPERPATQPSPTVREVFIHVAGDVKAAEIADWVKELWPGRSGPAAGAPEVKTSIADTAKSDESIGIGDVPVRLIWRPGDSEAIDIRASIPRYALIAGDAGAVQDLETAAWLIGVPHGYGPGIDEDHVWKWSCEIPGGSAIIATARTNEADAAADAAALLERAASIRAGRIPKSQLATAARLAAVSRVTRLDGSAPIVNAQPLDGGAARRTAPALRDSNDEKRTNSTIRIEIRGGSRDMSKALTGLGYPVTVVSPGPSANR